MIAIVASALLGIYVFLPEFLFKKLAIKFRVVTKTPRGRFEELISGASVVLVPFLAAAILSRAFRFVGHWPFPLDQDVSAKYADYGTALSSLVSDGYFRDHLDATWSAVAHIRLHQCRFLFWMYLALAIEILCVFLLTYFYGSLSRYPLYKLTFGRIFLGRASQWEVLLTGFAFPAGSRPQVAVDAMTTDNHLYAGTVADYFLKADGELSGLLLKDIRRFRFQSHEQDRKSGMVPDTDGYWKDIPGANFYLPADKIANLNIKYVTAPRELRQDVEDLVESMDLGIPFTVELEPLPTSNAPIANGYSDATEGEDD